MEIMPLSINISWTASGLFEYFITAFVAFQFLFWFCKTDKHFLAVSFSLCSSITIIWYLCLGDGFWFMKTDSWLLWLLYFAFASYFIYFCFNSAKYFLSAILLIRREPLFAIFGFITGLFWVITTILFFKELTIQQPFTLFCMFLVCAGMYKAHVPTIYVDGEEITGKGYHGGDRFSGDNGKDYWYDGSKWHER